MTLKYALGLGKTIFNSSVALIPLDEPQEAQIALTERFNRHKNSGAWPETVLKKITTEIDVGTCLVAENRDVQSTAEFESYYDSRFPFLERLEASGLSRFSTLKNSIKGLTHHEAHAYGAICFSPFERALILILDGAGSPADPSTPHKKYEYLSLYLWAESKLTLLDKKYLSFTPSKIKGQTFCEGIGLFYEKTSEFIFNNKTEAGKVMGLAPFGKSAGLQASYTEYLESLDWSKQYQGKSKKEWEQSPHQEIYRNIAATVQENFEHFLFSYLKEVRERFPLEENLILTGGCALNCTFNGKLAQSKIFQKIFVPPNPGDEGIGLGCAFGMLHQRDPASWRPTPWNQLTSYMGLNSSVPVEKQILSTFSNYHVEKSSHLIELAADRLIQGEVIALYQGRSEVGPRALGNRSILASPLRNDLKNYLNGHVKFRESFRPYGCTVQWEKAHEFFDVEVGFENPFMSFAVPVRSGYRETLRDLSHVDGTSRMQTLHREQNSLFYDLLGGMDKRIGLPILLNTSLNVMNEPIVETVEDARRFLETSELRTMIVGDFLITRKD